MAAGLVVGRRQNCWAEVAAVSVACRPHCCRSCLNRRRMRAVLAAEVVEVGAEAMRPEAMRPEAERLAVPAVELALLSTPAGYQG